MGIARIRRALFLCAALLILYLSHSAAQADSIRYDYDAAGRVVQVTAPEGSAQYRYDSAGNLMEVRRTAASHPAIAHFTPNEGPTGTVVTIVGQGFGTTTSSNTVKFNGVTAVVSFASARELRVIVPITLTGKISVQVGNIVATSTSDFTVTTGTAIPAPLIADFSPDIGGAGATVTVNGSGFGTSVSDVALRVNGFTVPITALSETQLSFVIPADASAGKIQITTRAGSATSANDLFVLPSGVTGDQVGYKGRVTVDGASLAVPSLAPDKYALVLFDGTQGQYLGLGLSPVSVTAESKIWVRTPRLIDLLTSGIHNEIGYEIFTAATSFDIPKLTNNSSHMIVLQAPSTSALRATLTLSQDVPGVLGPTPIVFTPTRVGQNALYSVPGAEPSFRVDMLESTFPGVRLSGYSDGGVQLAVKDVSTATGQLGLENANAGRMAWARVSPHGASLGTAKFRAGATDLEISDLVIVSAQTYSTGYKIRTRYKVTNKGASTVGPGWSVAAYLSSDAILDDNDSRIGDGAQLTPQLPPGASHLADKEYFIVPTTIGTVPPPGNYTLFVKVDAPLGSAFPPTGPGLIVESNESNNTVSVLVPLRVDLVIIGLVVGTPTKSGTTYTIPVSYTVKNNGGTTVVPTWYDSVHLSVDDKLQDTDWFLGNRPSPAALGPGESYTVRNQLFTTTRPRGNYKVFVKADGQVPGGRATDNGSRIEINEMNNAAFRAVTLP